MTEGRTENRTGHRTVQRTEDRTIAKRPGQSALGGLNLEAPPPHLRHQRGLVGGDGLLEVLLALGVLVGEPELA